MWEQLKREPKTIYHFTRRENIEKITNDKQLKKFKDTYVFACESYEDAIEIIKGTFLNPNARYLDFDGIYKHHNNKKIKDYVVLKLQVQHSKILNWYKSKSSNDEKIDGCTIAYKGNLPVKLIEVLEIKID